MKNNKNKKNNKFRSLLLNFNKYKKFFFGFFHLFYGFNKVKLFYFFSFL